MRPNAVLATNTSYLDPDVHRRRDVAARAGVWDAFLFARQCHAAGRSGARLQDGAHVLATGIAVARKLGKLPVVSGVCEGFIGNRIFSAYRREAEFMLEDGALPHEIDAAMEPLRLCHGSVRRVRPRRPGDRLGATQAPGRDARTPAERYVDIADGFAEAGRFGQKTGRGWYTYAGGKRATDPEVTTLIERSRAAKGIAPRQIPEGRNRLAPARGNGGGGQGDPGGRHRRTGWRHRSGDDQRLRLSGPQGRTDVRGGVRCSVR